MRNPLILPLLAALSLSAGCGTVVTLSSTDHEIQQALSRHNSSCTSIPRIYSGVVYSSCVAHSRTLLDARLDQVIWADVMLSGALDTVVLPYTAYRQVKDGNITSY